MLGSQVIVVKAFEVVFFQIFTALNSNDLEETFSTFFNRCKEFTTSDRLISFPFPSSRQIV